MSCLFLDGIHLKLRPEDKRAVAILCAYAIAWDGRKVLLHLAGGDKESCACREAFLEDLKRRGLSEPLLVGPPVRVLDGNTGVRKAVRHTLAGNLVQRCQVHKLRNVLAKRPHQARPTLKKLIRRAFTARTYAEGIAPARAVIAEHREALPAAMACRERDLDERLKAPRFPFAHRRQIRTTPL